MPAIAAVAQCATPSAAAAVAARRCRLRRPVAFAAVSSRAGARRQRPASTRASSGAAEPGPEPAAAGGRQQAAALGPRDDDVLPDSLTGALEDSSQATVEALERGVDRCIVSNRVVWIGKSIEEWRSSGHGWGRGCTSCCAAEPAAPQCCVAGLLAAPVQSFLFHLFAIHPANHRPPLDKSRPTPPLPSIFGRKSELPERPCVPYTAQTTHTTR